MLMAANGFCNAKWNVKYVVDIRFCSTSIILCLQCGVLNFLESWRRDTADLKIEYPSFLKIMGQAPDKGAIAVFEGA